MPRIIAGFSIGGTSNDQTKRCIGWPELLPGGGGSSAFVQTRVLPAFSKLGAEYGALWNPWGQTISGGIAQMKASQLLLAQKAGLTETYTNWVEAWKPLTALTKEMICYCGGMYEDKSFWNLSAVKYMKHMRECFNPVWQAGMSQGFDAEVLAPNTSSVVEAVRLIKESRPVYVEAWWQIKNTWCWDLPCIIGDDFYRTLKSQNFSWVRPFSANLPEVIRIVRPPAGESVDDMNSIKKWMPNMVKEIMADGHSVLVNGHPFVDTMTPFSILTGTTTSGTGGITATEDTVAVLNSAIGVNKIKPLAVRTVSSGSAKIKPM